MRIGRWEIQPTRISREFGFDWRSGITAPGLPTTSPPIDRSAEDRAHDGAMERDTASTNAAAAATAENTSQLAEQARAPRQRGPSAGMLLASEEDRRMRAMMAGSGYGQAARRTLLG